MAKRIKNVYDYRDYRVLLQDEFLTRSSRNHSYSLRAFARDLSLSPGFVSDILRGRKELSPTKGRQAFSRLGFGSGDLEYIEKLIVIRYSRDEAQKQAAREYVQAQYNRVGYKGDSTKDLLVKSVAHFIVYGVIRRVSKLSEIFAVTDRLEISRDSVAEILAELVAEGYVVEASGDYAVADEKLTIRNHARMVATIRDYSDLLITLLEKQGGNRPPEALGHALILGLNEESFQVAVEAHRHFIKGLHRISKDSSKVDRFVFLSDLWFTVK